MIGYLINRALKSILRRMDFMITFYIKCRGDDSAYLRHLGVRVGRNCSIYTRPHNFGTEPWLVEIGDNVTLGQDVMFINHDGASRLFRDLLNGMNPLGNRFGAIKIHDNSFIGNRTILLPGVQVGPEAVVGAGSVVTKTVPPHTVAAGNPARPIKTLDEYIESYSQRMIPLEARDREALRTELTQKIWGERR